MPVTNDSRSGGQALAEFSITILIFLVILMGVVDFGMAIYKYNGVSQAAREIARVTSVHPCAGPTPCAPGSSMDTQDVIATQANLIPGLTIDPITGIQCIDDTGAPVAPDPCDFSKDSVRVTVSSEYRPITPLLGFLGTWTMEGASSAQIQ